MELAGHFPSLPMVGNCHMGLMEVKSPFAKKPPAVLALPNASTDFRSLINTHCFLIQLTELILFFFFFCKIAGEVVGGEHFMFFLKTKKAKHPLMNLPQNKQPKIFLLWQSSYLGWRGWGCVSGSSGLNKRFSQPRPMAEAPEQGGSLWNITLQLLQSCHLTVGTGLCLAFTHNLQVKTISVFTFIKMFVFDDSATSNSWLLHWPFSLQLPSSVHLPVSACGTQVHMKMWQVSLLM